MTGIVVENDGQAITATNYWGTEHAEGGLVYLSINAGAVRLLLPEGIAGAVLEAGRGARLVLLSRGPWSAHGGRDAVEVLLEDDTSSPYALHLDARQADRLWGRRDDGRKLPCTFWVRGEGEGVRKALELPARVRLVPEIPWLRPWRG